MLKPHAGSLFAASISQTAVLIAHSVRFAVDSVASGDVVMLAADADSPPFPCENSPVGVRVFGKSLQFITEPSSTHFRLSKQRSCFLASQLFCLVRWHFCAQRASGLCWRYPHSKHRRATGGSVVWWLHIHTQSRGVSWLTKIPANNQNALRIANTAFNDNAIVLTKEDDGYVAAGAVVVVFETPAQHLIMCSVNRLNQLSTLFHPCSQVLIVPSLRGGRPC